MPILGDIDKKFNVITKFTNDAKQRSIQFEQ